MNFGIYPDVFLAFGLWDAIYYLEVAVVFMLMICALVSAHELGHFLAARSVGAEIEEFAIGFGKKLKTLFHQKETEFTLRLWPLGGFIRIKGMEPQEDGSEVNIKNGFYSKTPLQRLWMLFAGPLFSLLFGAIVLFGVYLTSGVDKISNQPILGKVEKNEPAYNAGLRIGDRILNIDNNPTETYMDIINYVGNRPDQNMIFTYERDGKIYSAKITTSKREVPATFIPDEKHGRKYLELREGTKIAGVIGALPKIVKAPASFGECFYASLAAPVKIGKSILGLIANPAEAKKSAGSLGSIAVATAEATRVGISQILLLSAALSISLGYFNLLPIPPLDGGQMFVAFIELFRRGKRLSIKVQNAIGSVGFIVLMLLIVSVLWLDVKRAVTGDWSNVAMGEKTQQTDTSSTGQNTKK